MILETTLLTRGRGVAVAFLFSALAGAVALAPPARADDVSDTSVGAMPIPIGVTVGAAIQTVGDVDWFVVQDPLLGDGALYVDTDGLRPRVRVFDALLRQVAANQIAPGFTGPVEQRIPLYPGIAEPIRIEVRRQSGPLGAYRLRVERVVLAPPVLPKPLVPGFPAPPLPGAGAPALPGAVVPDAALAFDAVADSLQRATYHYAMLLQRRPGFVDGASWRLEVVGALAIRERWMARDDGQALLAASQDPLGSLETTLARFGASPNGAYGAYAARLRDSAIPGGGSAAQVLATVQRAVAAGRPLLLVGRRFDRLLEAWVVFGFETVGGGTVRLLAVDPSVPGAVVRLRLDSRGIAPLGSGTAAVAAFALHGADRDALP